MGAYKITSRAIVGQFYLALSQNPGLPWVEQVSMLFDSNQESEDYAWLGQAPAMREWIGGRQAKGLREESITIKNKLFESTLEIPTDWLRRDKTGQIALRIEEMARRTRAHWAKLLSMLIANGESAVCYDGQYFFDTDHAEGDSGTQSNDISVDISTLPVGGEFHGSTTKPSPEELAYAALEGVEKMLSYKDDQGEPMNEHLSEFLCMLPPTYMHSGFAALNNAFLAAGRTNTVVSSGLDIKPVINPRLPWTEKFALFGVNAGGAPFIRQEEKEVQLDAVAEGSELEFNKRVHHYGVSAMRNVGYGYWQRACLVTLT